MFGMFAPRALAVLCATALAACGSDAVDRAPASAPSPRATPPDVWLDAQPPEPTARPAPAVSDDPAGKDFADEVRLLYRVAACGSDAPLPPEIDAATVKAHCDEIRPRIAAYRT